MRESITYFSHGRTENGARTSMYRRLPTENKRYIDKTITKQKIPVVKTDLKRVSEAFKAIKEKPHDLNSIRYKVAATVYKDSDRVYFNINPLTGEADD